MIIVDGVMSQYLKLINNFRAMLEQLTQVDNTTSKKSPFGDTLFCLFGVLEWGLTV